MRYAYEHCLDCKRYHPDIWYSYAYFENCNGDAEAASQIFQRAIAILCYSNLLHFAYADHLENRMNLLGATGVYENLIKDYPSPIAYLTYQRFARRTKVRDLRGRKSVL